jgi:hypothetical protein
MILALINGPTMYRFSALLLSLLIALWAAGCDLLPEPPGGYDRLSMEQRPYRGDPLRMHGFYADTYYAPGGQGPFGPVYFFYRNGAIWYAGTFDKDLHTVTQDDFFSERNDNRSHWGLFQVDGDRMAFERWYPANKGYRTAYVRAGRILNDSTFVITKSWRSTGGKWRDRNETYRFYPFHPKPDSTSRYLR